MKKRNPFFKLILSSFIFLFVLTGVLFPLGQGYLNAGEVKVSDMGINQGQEKQTMQNIGDWVEDRARTIWEWVKKNGIAIAYKKALGYFLNQLAYDAATYLATGDKGQDSMFYTENWGDYLRNAADNAAGEFLESLGEDGPVKFDLCDPGLAATMKIGYGLYNYEEPQKPDCTFTEMRNNWESALSRDNFLGDFSNMFQSSSNDFGIALSLEAELMGKKIESEKLAEIQRSVNQGMKDVTEPISGAIKTPAETVRQYMQKIVDESGENYYTYTGSAVADAIDVFTDTLISKLMDKWLIEGLSGSKQDTSYQGNYGNFASYGVQQSNYSGSGGLTTSINSTSRTSNSNSSYEADVGSGGGISQARQRFKEIVEPNFSVKGDYEALSDLVTCTNPVKSKPNECVITDDFRQAIENRMTLAKALEEGYLNRNGAFGFRADGLEPSFNEGFPYRSMLILRKYRIIPVGWELAAQYILDHQNQSGMSRTFSIYDMMTCFDHGAPAGEADRYVGYSEEWCSGLVDPSWVFKAPQNFCKREGPGPYVLSSQISGEGPDSKLSVTRDDTYCADEQTCIRENDDGACEVYGYCTKDRRKYNFDGSSCEANYNTCMTFRAGDGRTESYLENTLDYGSDGARCDADNAGCRLFKQSVNAIDDGQSFDEVVDRLDWGELDGEIRLDSSAEECDEEEEGCHEFIRTKAGIGANLLSNGGFEEYSATGGFRGWNNIGNLSQDRNQGQYAVELVGDLSRTVNINEFDINDYVSVTNDEGTVLDAYDVVNEYDLGGSTFTLSVYAKNCDSSAVIRLADSQESLQAGDEWRLVAVTHQYDEAYTGRDINITTSGADSCLLDAMKLEFNTPNADGTPTRYTNYRDAGLTYLKILPNYLYETCYEFDINMLEEAGDNAYRNGFVSLRSDAPAVCSEYTRYCSSSELNCNLYTSISENFSVPAVVEAQDYCPEECVGYDEYTQSQTRFELPETEYMIPESAEICSAQAAGCDAFTSLDELDDPEAREYFSNLRRCVNPDSPEGASCAPFFMWEGSDQTGYQLRVHQLYAPSGSIEIVGEASNCSTDIENQDYDPNCREYYDANGVVTRELYFNTVSCSAECNPYRKALVDDLATEEANCIANNGAWDSGGYCVYHAVASESTICTASQAGCREYNGNAGANTRIILEHNFENGTNMSWDGGENSTASVMVGEHSLSIDDQAILTLGSELRQGRSYVLQFLALLGGIDSISIGNDAEQQSFDGSDIESSLYWNYYEVNIENLGHEVDPENERIIIQADTTTGDSLFIDNIRLIEVTDRHYLIEDSWNDVCEFDVDGDGNIDEGYYAGCDAYTDVDNRIHYLYNFSNLCADSAVGCELMIDTHNYSDYQAGIWHDGGDGVCDPGDISCRTVPADSYAYVVYNPDLDCSQEDKGCERLGLEYTYEYPSMNDPYHQYFDIYKKNNPDLYNESLCELGALQCDAWETGNGLSYFKDPADMVCEWRLEDYRGLGRWSWLKKEVKRCDANGDGTINLFGDTDGNGYVDAVEANNAGEFAGQQPVNDELRLCSTAADCFLADNSSTWCEDDEQCGGGTCVNNECRDSCILDTSDYLCELDNNNDVSPPIVPKTIGVGGISNKIEQPLGDMEGEDWVAACPASQSGCTEYIDPVSSYSFEVDVLKPYTLYILDSIPGGSSVDGNNDNLPDENPSRCPNLDYYLLDTSDNILGPGDVNPGDIFFYRSETDCRFNADDFSIRKAVVDYQIESSLDKSSCNGMVDLDQGCILIDERSVDSAGGYSYTMYDADPSRYTSPSAPFPGDNSNVLLKINPDRVCDSWLACRSFIKDNEGNDVCYDVGQCERLDENGNCSYFSRDTLDNDNQVYQSNDSGTVDRDDIANMTGYSKVGYGSDNSLRADMYHIGDMNQFGQLAYVPNGSFEFYDGNMYPIGWSPEVSTGAGMNWSRDMFKVINNPVGAQTEKINYPVDGNAFLKFGARDAVMSEPITLVNNEEYIMTLYVNTMNLALGEAEIDISRLSRGGGVRRIGRSKDWHMVMIPFTALDTQANGADPRIRFRTVNGGGPGDGNVYIDNVMIKPTLNNREMQNGNEWYTPQTCRLYPADNALSCDYMDDNGGLMKGWPGYCLEYDRYPGDSDACLLWYPVDRVNGDGVEEGGGYIDRQPLYYCTATKLFDYGVGLDGNYTPTDAPTETENFVESNNFGAYSSGDIDVTHRNPRGYSEDEWQLDQLGLSHVEARWLRWNNISHIRIRHTSTSVYCDGKLSQAWDFYYRFNQDFPGADCPQSVNDGDCSPWGTQDLHEGGVKNDDSWLEELCEDTFCDPLGLIWDDDDDFDDHAVPGGIRLLDPNGDSFTGLMTSNFDSYCNHPDYHIKEIMIFPKVDICTDIVQTVTPMGQTQHYSSVVYEGSDATPTCNTTNSAVDSTICEYISNKAPFGAISQPGLATNDWSIMSNPYMWDTREGVDFNQPLFFEVDRGKGQSKTPHMGQQWTEPQVGTQIFNKFYEKWTFADQGDRGLQQVIGNYRYQGSPGVYTEPSSAERPAVTWMSTSPSSGNILANKLVNLEFTTDVDPDHLPLTMYNVDWGDGTKTSVSGIEMRDRPERENPHSLYHIYREPGQYTIRVQVRDNWNQLNRTVMPNNTSVNQNSGGSVGGDISNPAAGRVNYLNIVVIE